MNSPQNTFVVEPLEGRTFLSASAGAVAAAPMFAPLAVRLANIVGTFKGHAYSYTGGSGAVTFVVKTESAADKRGVAQITGTETSVVNGKTYPNTFTGTIKGVTFTMDFTGKYTGVFSGSVVKSGAELTGTYTNNVPDHARSTRPSNASRSRPAGLNRREDLYRSERRVEYFQPPTGTPTGAD